MSNENKLWLDPKAETCAEIADACYSNLSEMVDPAQRATRYFALPGITLEVEIIGRDVGDALCAAFAHLKTDSVNSARDTIVWRIVDSGLLDWQTLFPPAPIPDQKHGNFSADANADIFVERRNGLVSVYAPGKKTITSICSGINDLENDVIAKPLLRFLIGILQQKSIYISHAALIGKNGRGLLVTGKGGVGKSTISSASVGGGLDFCADDFVALEKRDGKVFGHSLYATVLLNSDQLAYHPHFDDIAHPSTSLEVPKTLVTMATKFSHQMVRSMEVDAIAVPKICTNPSSSLTPTSKSAVLRALTPTSVFSSPWREVDRAHFLLDLAQNMDCFTYLSGSDFLRIPDPIKERYGV